ncbi:hypothetical protein LMED105_04437 [Limnobacter sp. MED105]|nr:hypothetical protein LMED105_04437 [Limnobacter sp. MED105]
MKQQVGVHKAPLLTRVFSAFIKPAATALSSA